MSNPSGRQPIGINQPPSGGSYYPFVRPSEDVQQLLGDLFLSFDDIQDDVTYPLKVAWMYGFGDNAVSPPVGYPTPVHARELLIVDANDVTVFDSTTAAAFNEDAWDDRLRISEWVSDVGVLRCTQHTAWTQADIDDGQTRSYDDYIVPESGEIQADCWYVVPKRVKSIQVGLDTVSANRLKLLEGYNCGLELQSDSGAADLFLDDIATSSRLVPGERDVNRILISADPGDGLGVFPGCDDSAQFVRSINNQPAADYGNFTMDGLGCIRYQRPVTLVSSSPRTFRYGHGSISDTEAQSAIQFSNDCENCCQCEYFARTYQGLKRQWFLYQDIASGAENARDLYADNIDRWEEQKALREGDPLKVRVSSAGEGKMDWGLNFCNTSKCCITSVGVRLTWLYYVDGVLAPPATPPSQCSATEIDGSEQCNGPETIAPASASESGLVQTYYWNYSDPQTMTSLRGRHCFEDAENEEVKIILHVATLWTTSLPDPDTGEFCTNPFLASGQYPTDVRSTWTSSGVPVPTDGRYQKNTDFVDVDKDSRFCLTCECITNDAGTEEPSP